MPRKQQTNVEFLSELMEFSRFGAMVQFFVIEALRHRVAEVANYPHPEHYSTGAFDGSYWQEIAKDLDRQLTEKYGPYHRFKPATDDAN